MTDLNPFFKYFGTKWRSSGKIYPKPQYDTIIEPFAGSAGYSLRYADHNVILCDLDPIVSGLWSYLIRAKPDEILSLPDLDIGQSVDELDIPQEAKWLIGFWINMSTSPCKTMSSWMIKSTHQLWWGNSVRYRIASQLESIRHWLVCNCDYRELPTIEATWFIDPPYFYHGKNYKFSQIDYYNLADWCRSRPGQVIVCENEGAAWMPFRELATVQCGMAYAGRVSKEVYWLNSFEKHPAVKIELEHKSMSTSKIDRFLTPTALVTATMQKLRDTYPYFNPTTMLEPGAAEAVHCDCARIEFPSIARSVALDVDSSDKVAPIHETVEADFRLWPTEPQSFDLIATNPPYSYTEEFIWRANELLSDNGIGMFLCKIGIAGSIQRLNLWRSIHLRHVWVVVPRPSFTGSGSDGSEYAYFVFSKGPVGSTELDWMAWR